MDLVLYQTVLYAACLVNFLLALLLLFNNYEYRKYDIYHRSCKITAINYINFAIGFFFISWQHPLPISNGALSMIFHLSDILNRDGSPLVRIP